MPHTLQTKRRSLQSYKDKDVGRRQLEGYVEGGFQPVFCGTVPFVMCYHPFGSKAIFGFYGQDGRVSLCLHHFAQKQAMQAAYCVIPRSFDSPQSARTCSSFVAKLAEKRGLEGIASCGGFLVMPSVKWRSFLSVMKAKGSVHLHNIYGEMCTAWKKRLTSYVIHSLNFLSQHSLMVQRAIGRHLSLSHWLLLFLPC